MQKIDAKPLAEQKTLSDNEILEMTNVPQSVHRLSVRVKLNILHPGAENPKYSPQIKVFMTDLDDSFTIELNKDESRIKILEGDPTKFLNTKQTHEILDHIKRYRLAYLSFYNSQQLDTDDLKVMMHKIDVKHTAG